MVLIGVIVAFVGDMLVTAAMITAEDIICQIDMIIYNMIVTDVLMVPTVLIIIDAVVADTDVGCLHQSNADG